jgi:hypothetical protein
MMLLIWIATLLSIFDAGNIVDLIRTVGIYVCSVLCGIVLHLLVSVLYMIACTISVCYYTEELICVEQ